MIPCQRALESLRNLSNDLKVTMLLRSFEAIKKPLSEFFLQMIVALYEHLNIYHPWAQWDLHIAGACSWRVVDCQKYCYIVCSEAAIPSMSLLLLNHRWQCCKSMSRPVYFDSIWWSTVQFDLICWLDKNLNNTFTSRYLIQLKNSQLMFHIISYKYGFVIVILIIHIMIEDFIHITKP